MLRCPASHQQKLAKPILGSSATQQATLLLILRRHFPKFCVLFGEILAEKSTIELFEIGWNVVCKLFKDANPYEFKVMSDVEIQLLPFECLVFDTDLIHWGGPYCQSGYLNLRFHI